MKIKQILFDIPFPIELFKKNKINLASKKQREMLFKRRYNNLVYRL